MLLCRVRLPVQLGRGREEQDLLLHLVGGSLQSDDCRVNSRLQPAYIASFRQGTRHRFNQAKDGLRIFKGRIEACARRSQRRHPGNRPLGNLTRSWCVVLRWSLR